MTTPPDPQTPAASVAGVLTPAEVFVLLDLLPENDAGDTARLALRTNDAALREQVRQERKRGVEWLELVNNEWAKREARLLAQLATAEGERAAFKALALGLVRLALNPPPIEFTIPCPGYENDEDEPVDCIGKMTWGEEGWASCSNPEHEEKLDGDEAPSNDFIAYVMRRAIANDPLLAQALALLASAGEAGNVE